MSFIRLLTLISNTQMPLTHIDMCSVYDSRQCEQTFAIERIVTHYDIRALEARGVEIARVRYVLTLSLARP